MKHTTFLIFLTFFGQSDMTASNSHETCHKLVQMLSPGQQEDPEWHVDDSFIITFDPLRKEPIPLEKKFSCFFFVQKDKQMIENFWFQGKNKSGADKKILLENMFSSALEKTAIYEHASFQDITKWCKKEETKLLWFKYNLRTFYFNELNKKTLSASQAQNTLKKLWAIEESYPSNYPNPFLIILLRELSTLKKRSKPDHTTTPFITELKRYGLFSDLDRIIASDTTQFELESDEETPF